MKRKVALADVLCDAANEHLSHDMKWPSCSGTPYYYSCSAVWHAQGKENYGELLPGIADFLEKLGCETGAMGLFSEFKGGEERQGVRYMWLLLAMHVAEDEGIEIEVESA
jgi:hypothetical protein